MGTEMETVMVQRLGSDIFGGSVLFQQQPFISVISVAIQCLGNLVAASCLGFDVGNYQWRRLRWQRLDWRRHFASAVVVATCCLGNPAAASCLGNNVFGGDHLSHLLS